MSEMRQRHGGSGGTGGTITTTDQGVLDDDDDGVDHLHLPLYMGGSARWQEDEIEDILRSSILPRKMYRMPSLSNKAQKAKNRLAEDPYNMEYLKDLGLIYASEYQWELAANVLVRGMKRVSELKDAGDRLMYLMKLAEASFRCRKFRQAHAVLMDVDVPDDPPEKKAYLLLSCHTYAEIGDSPNALKAFSKALEGEEFESAIKIWAACALRLKAVGVFEAAKNAVMNKARTGPNYVMDQSRMQTVESWALLSSSGEEKGWRDYFNTQEGTQPWMYKGFFAVLAFVTICFLYVLESRSLQSMNLKG